MGQGPCKESVQMERQPIEVKRLIFREIEKMNKHAEGDGSNSFSMSEKKYKIFLKEES